MATNSTPRLARRPAAAPPPPPPEEFDDDGIDINALAGDAEDDELGPPLRAHAQPAAAYDDELDPEADDEELPRSLGGNGADQMAPYDVATNPDVAGDEDEEGTEPTPADFDAAFGPLPGTADEVADPPAAKRSRGRPRKPEEQKQSEPYYDRMKGLGPAQATTQQLERLAKGLDVLTKRMARWACEVPGNGPLPTDVIGAARFNLGMVREHLADAIGSFKQVPGDWRPTRTMGRPPHNTNIEVGSVVRVRPKIVDHYKDLLDPANLRGMTVTSIAGNKLRCKTPAGETVILPKHDLAVDDGRPLAPAGAPPRARRPPSLATTRVGAPSARHGPALPAPSHPKEIRTP